MSRRTIVKTAARLALLFCCMSTFWQPVAARAQVGESVQEMEQKVSDLIKRQQYTDALPLLEKLATAKPDDARTHFNLGFALIAQANITKDEATRKALRVRARNAYIKSKELGITEPVIDALIQSMSPDGADGKGFSQNAEANSLMNEAEALFAQGKLDDALGNYQKALQLDPKVYEAALFSGDVHTQRGDFQQAEIWYQKAIAIDPNRETAYRYSATP